MRNLVFPTLTGISGVCIIVFIIFIKTVKKHLQKSKNEKTSLFTETNTDIEKSPSR